MEGKKKNICRLCLKCGGGTFSPLDQPSKENLKVVVPELNLDATPNFVICSKCKESLAKSCELKKICSRTDHILRTQMEKKNITDKVHLNQIINIFSAADSKSPNTENYCRVCLKDKKVNYITIQTVDDLFTTSLESCLPELDVELTADPVICEICHDMLQNMYSFKNECLSVEDKLKSYSEATSEYEIDLRKVLAFLGVETEESAGEDFSSEFEVQDKEKADIFDNLPSSPKESSASEDNVKQVPEIYKIPQDLLEFSKSFNDKDAATNLSQSGTNKSGKKEKLLRCYSCRKYGHTSKECLQTFTSLSSGAVEEAKPPTSDIPSFRLAPRGTCVYCEKPGHANKACPNMKFKDGMLLPPKPRSQNGNESDADLQNEDNEKNFTEEMLLERIQANMALIGCLRCFSFKHEMKHCTEVKRKRMEKEKNQQSGEAERASQECSTERYTNIASNQHPQFQSRGAPGFRPQHQYNERYFSREMGDYGKFSRITEPANQDYSTERYTGFVSNTNSQSQSRGAPGFRPQYHPNERNLSGETRNYGGYNGRGFRN